VGTSGFGDFYIVTDWFEELVGNCRSSLAIHSSGRHIRASAHRDPKGIPIMKIISNVAPFICLIFTSLLLLPGLVSAQGVVESDTHRFTEIVPDVYHVTGTGSVYTMSNALVLVGESDVLVVDSHVTPAASEALLASLEVVSDQPVRYLVNSHYHFDHAHGNQSFPEGVDIIGHTFTRAKLSGAIGDVLEETTFRSFSDGVPNTVANLERQVAAETDPARKAVLEERYRVQRDYMMSIREVVPTPPNITLETEMTLYQDLASGSREVRLLHLGRAHTGGDIVIFLPEERLVFTGDMMLPGLSYMGDGHVDEWPATLEALKSLDFDVLLPGHGPPVRSKDVISNFQAYLTDLWQKTAMLHRRGVSAEQAAQQLDMTNHVDNYGQLRGPGVDPRAVNRMYELLDEQAAGRNE
jgi:glyoxylase-like metal-dependent hydrolase (beta-lactamase superfamily II)